MATAFPSLSRNPLVAGFSDGLAYDPTIRSRFDSGHVLTRDRHTVTKRRFTFSYNGLTDADKSALETFRSTVGGSGEITWTNPADSQSYTVRLDNPTFQFTKGDIPDRWACELSFTEV